MKVKAEKKGDKYVITLTDDLNTTIQVEYQELRKGINKAINDLFPKIK